MLPHPLIQMKVNYYYSLLFLIASCKKFQSQLLLLLVKIKESCLRCSPLSYIALSQLNAYVCAAAVQFVNRFKVLPLNLHASHFVQNYDFSIANKEFEHTFPWQANEFKVIEMDGCDADIKYAL